MVLRFWIAAFSGCQDRALDIRANAPNAACIQDRMEIAPGFRLRVSASGIVANVDGRSGARSLLRGLVTGR